MAIRKPRLPRTERRTLSGLNIELLVELRVAGTEEEPIIEGYSALFETLSENLGGFREKIRAGAFTQAILEDDVRALYNHDVNQVLGRNRAGTLEMVEDQRGLYMRAKPPKAQWALDLMESIRRRDVTQQSFSFPSRSVRDEWTQDEDGRVIRTLLEVRLLDVGPVTFPAYTATSVQARSLDGLEVTAEDFAEAFHRARTGEELEDEDRKILASISQVLTSLPVVKPEQAQQRSDGQPAGDRGQDPFALRKRRLELASKS